MITSEADINEYNLTQEMDQIARRLNLKNAEESLYFPKYFQIETTRVCNAHCPFCVLDQSDKSVPFMPDQLFEKSVKEMSHYSDWIEFVAVQRAGEPLLDKKIVSRVHQLKQAGIKRVSISTNASLLTEQKARDLLEVGLDEIMLSIDSVDKKIYQQMRVGLDFETVVKNIKNFFLLRDEIKPATVVRVRGVSLYDMKNEQHRTELAHWEDFWGFLKKPHDRIYMKRAHNWGNQKEWEGKISEYDWVYHPCVLPWSTMHITAMGIVPLCPQDYDAKMNIGDVNVQSIAEVWQNGNWARIRQLHQSGKRNEIPFCRGCRLFDLDFSLENWQQKQLYEG